MLAVPEEASLSKLLNIGECNPQPDSSIPELDLPHAWGINDHGAPGDQEELPVRGGVAAPPVTLPDLVDPLGLSSHEPVDYSRLPNSGGSE